MVLDPGRLPLPELRGGEDPDFSSMTPGEQLPDGVAEELIASGYGQPGITSSLETPDSPAGQPWPLARDWFSGLG
jgi:hypothetical protein